MIMTLMTLHDEPKQKHNAHILRRSGVLGCEHFWENDVSKSKGRNQRRPSIARPTVTSHRSIGSYCFFGPQIESATAQ